MGGATLIRKGLQKLAHQISRRWQLDVGRSSPTLSGQMKKYSLPFAAVAALLATSCSLSTTKPRDLAVEIVSVRPHDAGSYTQGFQMMDGRLFESAGMYGESNVREVDPATGAVIRRRDLPAGVFGEGLTLLNGKIYTLTWREQTAYVLNPSDLSIEKTINYGGEGWGLTSDGTHLILSDGTSTLQFIDPETFNVVRKLRVTENGIPLMNLNELEFIDGAIYANVYETDRIVRIRPGNGKVSGTLDLSSLRTRLPQPNRAEVLNGIAYDQANGHLFVTGKYWPAMFELKMLRD